MTSAPRCSTVARSSKVAPGRRSSRLTSAARASASSLGRSRPTRRSTISPSSWVAKFTRYASSPSWNSTPEPSASSTPRPGCASLGSYPRMAKTAMSDSGAMSGPTVYTSPCAPFRARPSRTGVRAASSGVRPPSSGIGSSARPSRHTYRSWLGLIVGSLVLHDEGELLGIQARPSHERPVDLRMGHELPDVAGLHTPAVLDSRGFGRLAGEHRADGSSDQRDHLARVGGAGVASRADGPDGFVRDHGLCHPCRLRAGQRGLDLAHHLGFGAAGVSFLQAFADSQDGSNPRPENGPDLLRDGLVDLAEELPALGVAHDHVPALQRGQHGGRDLAGERAFLLPVHVL